MRTETPDYNYIQSKLLYKKRCNVMHNSLKTCRQIILVRVRIYLVQRPGLALCQVLIIIITLNLDVISVL